MKYVILLFFIITLIACQTNQQEENSNITNEVVSLAPVIPDSNKVQVLNFGTFHMDFTTDGHSIDFDEDDQKNLDDLFELSKLLSRFKPTVLIVETPPEWNDGVQKSYEEFLNSDKDYINYNGEIGLLAFAVGKLSGAKEIYGIDHKIYYNYRIAEDLKEDNDLSEYYHYRELFNNSYSRSDSFINMNVIEKLRYYNTQEYYDFMFNANADMLTHVSSDTLFEGADEAAKFYHRNLRMYSNLNKLDLQPNDRVFILMGAAHTAYFDMFLKRSPKYFSVPVEEYMY